MFAEKSTAALTDSITALNKMVDTLQHDVAELNRQVAINTAKIDILPGGMQWLTGALSLGIALLVVVATFTFYRLYRNSRRASKRAEKVMSEIEIAQRVYHGLLYEEVAKITGSIMHHEMSLINQHIVALAKSCNSFIREVEDIAERSRGKLVNLLTGSPCFLMQYVTSGREDAIDLCINEILAAKNKAQKKQGDAFTELLNLLSKHRSDVTAHREKFERRNEKNEQESKS